MNLIHRRTASVLFTILVFTLLIALLYRARLPLTAFIFAILFAYLLDPIVERFQSWLRASRGLAVAATYLLLGAGIAAFGIMAGPRILTEGVKLGKELPALMENVGSGQIVQEYGSQLGWDYTTLHRAVSGPRRTSRSLHARLWIPSTTVRRTSATSGRIGQKKCPKA